MRTLAPNRRTAWVCLAAILLVASVAVAAVAIIRPSPRAEVAVGNVEDFPPGSVTEIGYSVLLGDVVAELPAGWAAPHYDEERRLERGRSTLFVVNVPGDGLLALWARDPHLGCIVVALPLSELQPEVYHPDAVFYNPCHGEQYVLDGSYLAGPAPRGLDRFGIEVRDGDRVVIDVRRYEPGPARSSP